VSNFEYIIAEWDNYPVKKDIHSIELVGEVTKRQVHDKIISAMQTLKELGIYPAYREKYCLY